MNDLMKQQIDECGCEPITKLVLWFWSAATRGLCVNELGGCLFFLVFFYDIKKSGFELYNSSREQHCKLMGPGIGSGSTL